ncbi:MAG: hypothetical protein PVF95_03620 [bacterium]|jgi:hypothetical protein
MIKRLFIACIGAAVLLSAGMAAAGVPCAGTSECNVSVAHFDPTVVCGGTEGYFCPLGDQDTVHVAVVIRDCYGNTLAGRDVTIDPPASGFFFCEASKQVTTDALGEASTFFTQFGGCGFLQMTATSEGVSILGNLVYAANVDCLAPASGDVTLGDFAQFAAYYNSTEACVDYDCSGLVALGDFARFAAHYDHSCP